MSRSASPPAPAHLVSIPQLAQMRGVPYSTLHRDLVALWERDVAEGGGDWLHRLGRRKKMWVNLSRLRRAHPVLFDARAVDRAELEEMQARIENLEAALRDQKQRQNAMAAGLRDVRNAARESRGLSGPSTKSTPL